MSVLKHLYLAPMSHPKRRHINSEFKEANKYLQSYHIAFTTFLFLFVGLKSVFILVNLSMAAIADAGLTAKLTLKATIKRRTLRNYSVDIVGWPISCNA